MQKNIVETAIADGSFTTLVSALQAADLVETLSGKGPFTVFAPTDKAFAKLPAGTVEKLLENKDELTKVLTYHVVSGKLMAENVSQLASLKTLQGSNLSVDGSHGVAVNNAHVTMADIETTNGVIHVIDAVMLPK